LGNPNTPESVTSLKKFKNRILKVFGMRRPHSLEEEVTELIEEHDPEGKQVSSEERAILTNVFNLNELRVDDVMIPRTDIVAVEDKVSLAKLKRTLTKEEHTRMPVYKGSLDHVTGFVHIKDLVPFLGSSKPFDIQAILREILYVPPSMKVLDLLVKMRSKRVHIALVLDEYGGTDGLVTMEDLMEEIVGEIEDEHDDIEAPQLFSLDNGSYEASARLDVEELEKALGVELKDKEDHAHDYDTVGGLIFFLLGRVPRLGEMVDHPTGVQFKVKEVDLRRIKTVIVYMPQQSTDEE
jgi:CBS domain containing-hemolysin-like protein